MNPNAECRMRNVERLEPPVSPSGSGNTHRSAAVWAPITPSGAVAVVIAATLFVCVCSQRANAQIYEVTWSTIDGGGVISASSTTYEARGTIGQPDAGELSSSNYSVTGGFWSATGQACFASTEPAPETLDLPLDPISQKIRYLSFGAGDAGYTQAVRVTFSSVPSPYDTWNGVQLYVQEPLVYCENAGVAQADPCPPTAGGLPQDWFWGAQLSCDPYFTDWTAFDTVHVWNEGIIPGASYDIQVVEETCSLASEANYSTPLTLTQSVWADLIQDCTTTPCKPPDGSTGIVDVTAILDKWKNLPGNVKKVRADIEGSPGGDHRVPDQSINITDVTYCLGAYLGQSYPAPGFPPPSPPPVCP